MRQLNAFLFISLDGYYKDSHNDISWHTHGGDESEFSANSLKAGNILLFGRVTYEMMVGFWTTDMAQESFPEVAAGMHKSDKIVFSNSLKKAEWANTTLIYGDIITQMRKLKSEPGKDMTILGSGTIVSQFVNAGLIDSLQIMIDPVVLGSGTAIFSGMKNKLTLKLMDTRTFKSGVVLLNFKLGL